MEIFLFDSKNDILPSIGVIEPQSPGELSRMDFGKPVGELGCYLNYEEHTPAPCTDRQRELIEQQGLDVPKGITRGEVNYILKRLQGKDTLQSPDRWMMDLANGLKIRMSAFMGAGELMDEITRHGNIRDRAALYCYGVRQAVVSHDFQNMLQDPLCDSFYSFANIVEDDQTLQRSLDDRPTSEFFSPKTSVKIYKAAHKFLADGGLI
ncbi:MAG: hypothetical protein IJH11_00310 [Lachnospiraceae bacterium]|nr:hypothetical protein [Lachnospiraceae bacterium]